MTWLRLTLTFRDGRWAGPGNLGCIPLTCWSRTHSFHPHACHPHFFLGSSLFSCTFFLPFSFMHACLPVACGLHFCFFKHLLRTLRREQCLCFLCWVGQGWREEEGRRGEEGEEEGSSSIWETFPPSLPSFLMSVIHFCFTPHHLPSPHTHKEGT